VEHDPWVPTTVSSHKIHQQEKRRRNRLHTEKGNEIHRQEKKEGVVVQREREREREKEEGREDDAIAITCTTSNNSNRSSRMQKGSSASAGMMASSARNIPGGNDSNNNNENDDRSRGGESVITNRTFNTSRTTTSLSIGILALLGKYPPDPEIQHYVKKIAVLKAKLIDYRRGTHRATIIEEQQRQRQLENSITQQKQVLVNKLLVKVHGCRYASGVTSNAPYEKEIHDVVHKPYELELKDLQRKDPIDDLLDTRHFDYGYKPDTGSSDDDDDDDDSCDEFCNDDEEYMDSDSSEKGGGGKDKDKKKEATKESGRSKKDKDSKKFTIVHSTLIPLEVKLVRSQHNEVMTDHQMECVRSFQQHEIEQLYELISQYQKEKKEELLSNTMQPTITELRDNNVALKNAYQAHMKAQEKMIALLREHVLPDHREPTSPSQREGEGEVNKNNDNHNNDV